MPQFLHIKDIKLSIVVFNVKNNPVSTLKLMCAGHAKMELYDQEVRKGNLNVILRIRFSVNLRTPAGVRMKSVLVPSW